MLGWPFEDTDQKLQNLLGRSITDFFEIYGELAFRDHETALLRRLGVVPRVLATGGGIVLREENWVELRRLGTVVFLDVKSERLVTRLSKTRLKRPLLRAEGWEQRLADLVLSRRSVYEQADVRIEVDDEPIPAVAERILVAVAPC